MGRREGFDFVGSNPLGSTKPIPDGRLGDAVKCVVDPPNDIVSRRWREKEGAVWGL